MAEPEAESMLTGEFAVSPETEYRSVLDGYIERLSWSISHEDLSKRTQELFCFCNALPGWFIALREQVPGAMKGSMKGFKGYCCLARVLSASDEEVVMGFIALLALGVLNVAWHVWVVWFEEAPEGFEARG